MITATTLRDLAYIADQLPEEQTTLWKKLPPFKYWSYVAFYKSWYGGHPPFVITPRNRNVTVIRFLLLAAMIDCS